LERLADIGALPYEAAAEYAEAYEDLLSLRLSLWAAGGAGDGSAEARGGRARLAERREDILAKAALAKASTLQKRLGYDFLGSAL
ncbi:MAG: hypothetical protein Q8M76_17515, partial [Spirochaetaceae bacterium]|nr:hypothetical protein [Spirochaetaceae bacterium]